MASQIPLSSQIKDGAFPAPTKETVLITDTGSLNMSNHPSIQNTMKYNDELKERAKRAESIPKAKSLKEHTRLIKEVDAAYETSELGIKQKQKICNILNRYKKKYDGQVEFKFKPTGYSPELSKIFLDSHLAGIRAELNCGDVETKIESLIMLGFRGLGVGVKILRPELAFLFEQYKNNVKEAMADGEYEEEIKQIGVELADMFAFSPYVRLANKLVQTGSETLDGSLGPTPSGPKNIPENMKPHAPPTKEDRAKMQAEIAKLNRGSADL